MKLGSSKLLLGAAALAAAASIALVARAWEIKAPFGAKVNDHEFYEFRVWNEECVFKARIRFNAPKGAYESGAPVRNYYRFKARIEAKDNLTIDSPVFFNRAPGKRVYFFSKDTAAGGCWAKQKPKIQSVDIEGCRGKGCQVMPFQRHD